MITLRRAFPYCQNVMAIAPSSLTLCLTTVRPTLPQPSLVEMTESVADRPVVLADVPDRGRRE